MRCAGGGHSGFLFGDVLLVTKFAEGDSRILMQKMVCAVCCCALCGGAVILMQKLVWAARFECSVLHSGLFVDCDDVGGLCFSCRQGTD